MSLKRMILNSLCLVLLGTSYTALSEPDHIVSSENILLLHSKPDAQGMGSLGTGFVVKADSGNKYIITNAHVCAVTDRITKNKKDIILKQIKMGHGTDLCLLKLPKELEYLEGYTMAAQEPLPTEDCATEGFPHGKYTFNTGIWGGLSPVDAMHDVSQLHEAYLILDVQPGQSGSPVFNRDQEVVGVVFARLADAAYDKLTFGFAVPLADLKQFLLGL